MPIKTKLDKKLPFTVDSALLRELGERLVGKPYIALAELVKNSYDADATQVVITVSSDRITVEDNGHGMTFSEFRDRWMRVGSTHKVGEQRSRSFGRPLTGSKGIGRLATQFLASQLLMTSVPLKPDPPESDDPPPEDLSELTVLVDWDSAVTANDLTKAEAQYSESSPQTKFPGDEEQGTTVTLEQLRHKWVPEEFEELAKEIWFLQPPFRRTGHTPTTGDTFQVDVKSPDPEIVAAFQDQMSRVLEISTSRLVGGLRHNSDGTAKIQLVATIEDFEIQRVEYLVVGAPLIDKLDFEIRVFDLRNRQPHGIPVKTARKYFNKYGGVHLYDAGFRIPHSGPSADWLRVEFDHAHRLSASKLLPKNLQVSHGMNNLPTNSRLWGVVNINTTHEARAASSRSTELNEHLEIQVSRDRLVENRAYDQLEKAVRWALDYYAMRVTVLRLERISAEREVLPAAEAVQGVSAVLDKYAADIPAKARKELEYEVDQTLLAVRADNAIAQAQVGLLSSLATAGIAALAYDHQIIKQFNVLESLLSELEASDSTPSESFKKELVVAQIQEWLNLARETHDLFSHLTDQSSREDYIRYPASTYIKGQARRMSGLLRGIEVDTSHIEGTLRLPLGTDAEWTSLFQNILFNASNAMIATPTKNIRIRSTHSGQLRAILVEDTGSGVDLGSAARLFEPFERQVELPPDLMDQGYGGSGLGLTIVRMLAMTLGCRVGFVKPKDQYNTCFRISWREDQQ